MVSLHRRQALGLFGASVLATALAPAPVVAPVVARSRVDSNGFLTARTRAGGRHGGAILSAQGEILAEFDLPGRGHGAAVRPGQAEGVVFARRPGSFAVAVNLESGHPGTVFEAPGDRHFYGHGCYAADGSLLYAAENDFEGERGIIGLYDARDGYRRVGEFVSQGIGPHEIALMPDGRSLVVANGGILTHPDAPRMKLNLSEMESSIVLIDARNGDLIRAFRLPPELRQLSLRHLAVRSDGRIVAVAQWEGSKLAQPPLVATIDPDKGLRLIAAPEEITARMRNYCGSVAFSRDGQRFAVSAPRGGLITLWDAEGGFREAINLEDGCGLAAEGEGFLLTSGRGLVTASDGRQLRAHADVAFDNHLTAF